MAYASKTFWGPKYGARQLYLVVEQVEKDITNNRSRIKATFVSAGSDASASLFTTYATDIDIAGVNVIDTPFMNWYGNGSPSAPHKNFPAAEGSVSNDTLWVNHDTQGNLTVNVYFYTGVYSSNTVGNYGGTFTLESIPRASQPSISGTTTMGNKMTIYTNRYSSAFTHNIGYQFGNASGTIATGVATSTEWTVPVSLANQIPNATSGTGTITCDTYNGSTKIGSKTVNFTLNVPSSVKPSVSIAFSEADATMISKGWGVYVKNKSKLSVALTATKSYSSNIKTYSSNIQGTSYSSASYTSNILAAYGNSNVTATVTDNRGRVSDTASKALTVIDYFKPTINSATVSRCTVDGTESDEGTYLLFSFAGSIAPVSNKNAKSFRIGYREKGSTSSYTWLVVSSAYTVSSSSVILTNSSGSKVTFSTDKSYEVRFEAIDSFETTGVDREIGTGFDLLNLNPSGNSMAIGKISEAGPNERKLEIALDTEYKGNALLEYVVMSGWTGGV